MKNHLILSLCLLALFIAPIVNGAQKEKQKPNIILICADDLGFSDIGCYGSEIKTPNLDKLASRGMRFNQFHNTSKCFPSRASLITGLYAQDCGYDKKYSGPLSNAVTIGEVLRENGYATYWSGKHHGKENPIYRGFDRYYGLKDGCCNYFNPGKQRSGEPQPAQKTPTRKWCIDSTEYSGYTPPEKDFYTTDYFTHYAIDFIKEATVKEKPFFLYLAYTAPHDPLMAWPSDIEKYKGKYDVGYEEIRKLRYEKQRKSGLLDKAYTLSDPSHKRWEQLSEAEKTLESQKMEVYAAMIDRMDQNIGRVLDELEELGQLDNSVIFFMSDNGASAEVVRLKNDNDAGEIGEMDRWVSLGKDWANVGNTPFRFYKSYSYEGGINTPLIAYWPKKIKAKSVSNFSSHFVDIMPTIIEISGAKYPKEFNGQNITPLRGRSLLPVMEGKDLQRENALFWQWNKGMAVSLNKWKIVKYGEEAWNLYNLEKDPTETRNLANSYPEKVKKLSQLYNEWISQY